MVVLTLIISQVTMLEAIIQRVGECAENEEQEDVRAKVCRDHLVTRRAHICTYPPQGSR